MESSIQHDMPDVRTLLQEAEQPTVMPYYCDKCHHHFEAPASGYSVMCPICKASDNVISANMLDPDSLTGVFQSNGHREREHRRP